MSDSDHSRHSYRAYAATAWRWLTWVFGRACLVAVLLAPTAVMAWRAWAKRWISDDGFINLRIVRNLLAGHGPVYNVGERVEAFTSTIWIGVVGVVGSLGIRLEHAAVAAGIALTLGALLAAQWAAAQWFAEEDESVWALSVNRLAVPVGVGMYVALPVAWDYASSGLETGLALFWLAASALAVVEVVRQGAGDTAQLAWRWWFASVVVGLAPLVRPGLTLFAIAWAVPLTIAWWQSVGRDASWLRRCRDVASSLGIGLALPILYEIFRLGYFATPVPNTALAKTAFTSQWQQGWYYAEHFFGLFYFSVPLAVACVLVIVQSIRHASGRRWARAAWGLAPLIAGAVYCVYIIRLGGGFMYGRLFLPAVFGMLIPVAVLPLRPLEDEAPSVGEAPEIAVRAGLVVVLTGWMLFCGTSLRVPTQNYKGIGDERGWYAKQANEKTPVRIEEYEPHPFHGDARYLQRRAERVCSQNGERTGEDDKELVREDCDRGIVYPDKPQTTEFRGLFPGQRTYPLQERFVDHGIRLTAMRTAIGIRGYVLGPRVHLVDHVGLADPMASRLASDFRGRPGHRKALSNPWMIARFAERQPVEDFRVSAARHALGCRPLSTLDRAVTAPLTLGQFVSNVFDAWGFWGLKLPRDPVEAREKFCGTPAPVQIIRGGPGGTEHRWRCPVDYHLEQMEVGTAPDRQVLTHLRPVCAPDSPDEVPKEHRRVVGPRIGGGGAGETVTLECEEGSRLVGFRGRADSFVRQLEALCQPGDGRGSPSREHATSKVAGYERGEAFEARCETRAVGMAARTGAIVDAAGVLCASN